MAFFSSSSALNHPIRSLIAIFIVWKLYLLIVALVQPGLGYDTSTSLLLSTRTGNIQDIITGKSLNFLRWDALYFTSIARRGYLFEQEWAFGYGFTNTLALLSSGVRHVYDDLGPFLEVYVGIAISHVCHLLSVLILYELSLHVFGERQGQSEQLSFLSAALHVFSPGGLFLSAPYTESPFSLLNFAGFYLYASSLSADSNSKLVRRDFSVVAAGILFGLATTFRGNGILSGWLHLYDVGLTLITQGLSTKVIRKLFFLVLGGSFVAVGFVLPQLRAYMIYCDHSMSGADIRPWCKRLVPSIYGWVQSHYWNVGFLRYWTVSNLPLFLLATPMLVILISSSIWALKVSTSSRVDKTSIIYQHACARQYLVRFAVPQLILAILAILSYHVQIITRISSGYPLWYWWLASMICGPSTKSSRNLPVSSGVIVRWMIMYAAVQAGLYAAFLPPA